MALRGKHRRILAAVFAEPTRADVSWQDVESLLVALGVELTQGRGSRVRAYRNGVRAVFHRPHPRKEVGKDALRSIRRFLHESDATLED